MHRQAAPAPAVRGHCCPWILHAHAQILQAQAGRSRSCCPIRDTGDDAWAADASVYPSTASAGMGRGYIRIELLKFRITAHAGHGLRVYSYTRLSVYLTGRSLTGPQPVREAR